EELRPSGLKLENCITTQKRRAEHLANVVLSSEEADKLFEEFHCCRGNTWCPHEAMYWPGTVEDIRRWIAECPQSHPRGHASERRGSSLPL
ncbi:hypothetical protein KUCAC02_031393, partial [Chaenocephalus aceratus]